MKGFFQKFCKKLTYSNVKILFSRQINYDLFNWISFDQANATTIAGYYLKTSWSLDLPQPSSLNHLSLK